MSIKNPSRICRPLILVGVTLGVFLLLFRKVDPGRVFLLLREIPAGCWLSAAGVTLLLPVLMAYRWQVMLRQLGFTIPFGRCLVIILGVWPVSAASPAKAGDLLRAMGLRHKIEPMIVIGTILAERLLDFLSLAVFAFLGGIILRNPAIATGGAVTALALILVVILAGVNIRLPLGEQVNRRVKDVLWGVTLLRRQRRMSMLIFLLTALKWFLVFVLARVLFLGVGADVPLRFIMAVLPVSIFVGLLPVTIGGMGIRESSMVVLFSPLAAAPQSLAVGLLYSFFVYWFLAVLGIPFMRRAVNW